MNPTTTDPTATVTTDAGNTLTVHLTSFVAGTILPWHSAEGEQPVPERIAAKLAGRHYASYAALDAALTRIVENDPTVFHTPNQWILNTEEYRKGQWTDCGDSIYGDDEDADDAIDHPFAPEDFGPGRYRTRARILGKLDSERWSDPVWVPPPTLLLDLQYDPYGDDGDDVYSGVGWWISDLDGDGWTEILPLDGTHHTSRIADLDADTLDDARRSLIGHLIDNGLALDADDVRIQPSTVRVDANEHTLARYDVLVLR